MKSLITKNAKIKHEKTRKKEKADLQIYKLLLLVSCRKNFVHFIVNKLYLKSIIFSLLQKNIDESAIIEKLLNKDEEADKFKRIRCPHCNWQPNASSKWFCSDCDFPEFFYGGCFTHWNTFNTKGICPGCSHKWLWTSCLSCSNWALHEDWYAKENQK